MDEPCSSKDATIEDLRLEIEEMRRMNAQNQQMIRKLKSEKESTNAHTNQVIRKLKSTNAQLIDIVERLTDAETDVEVIKQEAVYICFTPIHSFTLQFSFFSFLYSLLTYCCCHNCIRHVHRICNNILPPFFKLPPLSLLY